MSTENNSEDVKGKTNVAKDESDEMLFRVYNVLSYFTILVLIGIPMWWYTTRVYRASLPLDKISDVTLLNKSDKVLGIPLSLEYDILVTIVNPEPQIMKVELRGEEIEQHLRPFLHKLSPVADFAVKSQWLYLVELGAQPRKILDHYALYEEQLSHLITPLEKKLWSHLSTRPCINLVLYVSRCTVPLQIYDRQEKRVESNAFQSPGWGGIVIVNPDDKSCTDHTYKPNLQTVGAIFRIQLLKLLQIRGEDEASLVQLQESKAKDMVDSTRRTLKSLAQLLSEINSIVISNEVAERVNIAVENADLAENLLGLGRVQDALKFAKVAFNNSEAAFSDPSLLALLYFPDDQKYAVYIPLFLPVMIPVLMSLVSVRKWLKNRNNKLKTD